jgi:hypothetical protein
MKKLVLVGLLAVFAVLSIKGAALGLGFEGSALGQEKQRTVQAENDEIDALVARLIGLPMEDSDPATVGGVSLQALSPEAFKGELRVEASELPAAPPFDADADGLTMRIGPASAGSEQATAVIAGVVRYVEKRTSEGCAALVQFDRFRMIDVLFSRCDVQRKEVVRITAALRRKTDPLGWFLAEPVARNVERRYKGAWGIRASLHGSVVSAWETFGRCNFRVKTADGEQFDVRTATRHCSEGSEGESYENDALVLRPRTCSSPLRLCGKFEEEHL